MNAPIQVVGHPRSGTHLLASAIHKNLEIPVAPLVVPNKGTGHWTKRNSASRFCIEGDEQNGHLQIPYGRLLGSHHFPNRQDFSRCVYIIRDGRDVAVSFWKWTKFRPVDLPPDVTLDVYLRRPVDWRGSPGFRHPPRRDYLLFDHWRDHTQAWVDAGVFWIRYEDLVCQPQDTLRRISLRFNLKLTGDGQLPGPTGWNPSGGKPKVGTWRETLSQEMQDLFDEKVPKDHVGRWEPSE